MINLPYYPEWFQIAASSVWGAQAAQRLGGGQSSTERLREPSANAAGQWLRSLGHRPFLNEVALRSIVFDTPAIGRAAEASKAVDWVAAAADGTLILVEAKSALDSAGIGNCMDGRDKFSATYDALRSFALKGGQQVPRVRNFYITAKSIQISGSSSWRAPQGGGDLQQDGVPKRISGVSIQVVIVPFPNR